MKTLREMMDLVESVQSPFYKGYDDAYYDSKDLNPYDPSTPEYDDYDRGNKAGEADIAGTSTDRSDKISVGDTVTWWYNKAHPNYEGIVRKVSGDTIIVYAPGSGDTFKLSKSDIRSVIKGEEELEEASPDAIKRINDLYNDK